MATSPSDIRKDLWWQRILPRSWRVYAELIRLDRPIGHRLLFLPAAAAIVLAGTTLPETDWRQLVGVLLLFYLGAIIMRGAGCVVNDLWDRDFDQRVERTATRPLATGRITIKQALVFLSLLLALGFSILLAFNTLTRVLGLASLLLVAVYPAAKRFTNWPQVLLGLTFDWGVLMGWTALRGSLEAPALLLYLGTVFWTLGYDSIYAHQDKKDDEFLGLGSSALAMGEKSRIYISVFYGLYLLLAFLSGLVAGLPFTFLLPGIVLVGGSLAYQLFNTDFDDPVSCLKSFRFSALTGLLLTLTFLFAGLGMESG